MGNQERHPQQQHIYWQRGGTVNEYSEAMATKQFRMDHADVIAVIDLTRDKLHSRSEKNTPELKVVITSH